MARLDPHSYNDSDQPSAHHLQWRTTVDFQTRTLRAEATLHFREHVTGPIDLDTRALHILSVCDAGDRPIAYQLGEPDAILGTRLHLDVSAPTDRVTVSYRTSPNSSALQWLEPAQTSGVHPFLFSQCQAVHARSVVPLQDTPRIRITYEATLTVPASLRALMAASFVRRVEDADTASEEYAMRDPIPPYLFAFAVGDLVARDVGPRSRVWAEPRVVERASWEFAHVDAMLTAAEGLFGPYDWGRFDILTMPSSFPYGGMENPCLTFITPTLLAGDRSLVNVVAHELAHSWTGNLVSNANQEHFWLNEGFTVYAERRILELLEGPDLAALHAAVGWQELQATVAEFKNSPALTRLRTHLSGIDPDETYSIVPYEKGYLFLCALERAAGRDRFDAFLRHYLRTWRFCSITTDQFLETASKELGDLLDSVDAHAWLEGEGVPSTAPIPRSRRLDDVSVHVKRFTASASEAMEDCVPEAAAVGDWSVSEWQLFLERLPRPLPRGVCAILDERFPLTDVANPEILFTWLALAIRSGYVDVLPRVERALGEVGRMKFLKPLYQALVSTEATKFDAVRIYDRYRATYHPIAQQVLDGVMAPARASA